MEKRIANDPDDYYAKSYFKKKEGSKKRTCSYCSQQGHNRRTCPQLKMANTEWVRCNKTFRAKALTLIEESGIGVGALVTIPETYVSGTGYIRDQLAIITQICWEGITIETADQRSPSAITALLVGKYAGNNVLTTFPATKDNVLGWAAQRGAPQILSPATGSVAPPSGWSAGTVKQNVLSRIFTDDKWGSHWVYGVQKAEGGTENKYVPDTSGVMQRVQRWDEQARDGQTSQTGSTEE